MWSVSIVCVILKESSLDKLMIENLLLVITVAFNHVQYSAIWTELHHSITDYILPFIWNLSRHYCSVYAHRCTVNVLFPSSFQCPLLVNSQWVICRQHFHQMGVAPVALCVVTHWHYVQNSMHVLKRSSLIFWLGLWEDWDWRLGQCLSCVLQLQCYATDTAHLKTWTKGRMYLFNSSNILWDLLLLSKDRIGNIILPLEILSTP